MRRFCVTQDMFDNDKVIIAGTDCHYIKNVLRLKTGDRVQLVDTHGYLYHVQITRFTKNQVITIIIDNAQQIAPPAIHVTIAQSMLKEKKMDNLIRQATELGVSRWVSFISERSIPRPDANRMKKKVQRWRAIAQSAAQQCKGLVPDIHDQLFDFQNICSMPSENQRVYFFWENAHNTLKPDLQPLPESIMLIFGPEGGFSEQEATLARESGYIISSLGTRILRAETATIVGLTLIQYFINNLKKKT